MPFPVLGPGSSASDVLAEQFEEYIVNIAVPLWVGGACALRWEWTAFLLLHLGGWQRCKGLGLGPLGAPGVGVHVLWGGGGNWTAFLLLHLWGF